MRCLNWSDESDGDDDEAGFPSLLWGLFHSWGFGIDWFSIIESGDVFCSLNCFFYIFHFFFGVNLILFCVGRIW